MTSAMETKADVAAAREAAGRAIDDAADDLVRLSKFIHANPEVAMEEVRASAACADFGRRAASASSAASRDWRPRSPR